METNHLVEPLKQNPLDLEVTVYGLRPHSVRLSMRRASMEPGSQLEFEGRRYKVMSRMVHQGNPAINVMPQQHLTSREVF